jgi:hypothetical protein
MTNSHLPRCAALCGLVRMRQLCKECPRRLHYWLTPPELKSAIYGEFGLTDADDVCPYPRPTGYDCLIISWPPRAFANVPFNKPNRFVNKAIEEYRFGKLVILLLPINCMGAIARLDVAGAEIRYIGIPDWRAIEDGSISPLPKAQRQPCVMAILRPED